MMRCLLLLVLPQVPVLLGVSVLSMLSLPSASAGGALNLEALEYLEFPRRTQDEAAVLEWGNSAIISALDASVARFGPQTSQAALLEVECMPVLASPLNGGSVAAVQQAETEVPVEAEADEKETPDLAQRLQKLQNAEEIEGNMVVMTNNGLLTAVQMAYVAKLSGAAALLVVNVDEKRPDDIFRMSVVAEDQQEQTSGQDVDTDVMDVNADIDIDIPVVMVSLNSANVLTTATVEPGMGQDDIVNHGMPDRVRLYAAGDRPFFEDVEPSEPTLYLIHNLLTAEEGDHLLQRAATKVVPIGKAGNGNGKSDILQLLDQVDKYTKTSRAMLWQGIFQSQARKASEERIEQVTGFPGAHFSDFIVDRIEPGGYWLPHYDSFGASGGSGAADGAADGGAESQHVTIPIATITVFLTDNGGSLVYPSGKQPIKINPQKGMAVVHHNTDDKHDLDFGTIHGMLTNKSDQPMYVARKYIFADPVSNTRRIVLPALAMASGGTMPAFISNLHDWFADKFGPEIGPTYFDKAMMFAPILVLFGLVQYIAEYVQGQLKKDKEDKKSSADRNAAPKKKSKKN